jgi:hypothetical protein
MALNTNYFHGDSQHNILAKLLILFGGTPVALDGRSELLRKLLAEASAASAGLEVPLNFQDSADDVDAIVYHTGGATEAFRVVGSTGHIQLADSTARRIFMAGNDNAIALMGGPNKSQGAFIEIYGQNHASGPGHVTASVHHDDTDRTKGTFRVRSAPRNSTTSVRRFEVFGRDGQVACYPFWNDGGTTFTGFLVNATDTASADDTLLADLQVASTSVFSINKEGNVVQQQKVLTYAASVALDFDDAWCRTVALTGNIAFTTSNRGAGKEMLIRVTADGSLRTLTFPAGWTFVGAEPADIAASKVGLLSIRCFGSADSDILAAWAVEE